jgi:sulfite exporter TauE/SafE/plastocyanin domain-containing protein/copper chaperone CopZ
MSTKQDRIAVQDMHCKSCETRVEKELRRISGVSEAKASFSGGWVEVKYNSHLTDRTALERAINHAGYRTNPAKSGTGKLAGIFFIVAAIILLSNVSDTFDIGTELKQNLTFAALFAVGLFTSLHCIGMCGGIMFSQSISTDSNNKLAALKPSILYNSGRLLAYTLLGGLVGAIGSVFSLSLAAKAGITLIAAILMIFMGLGMTGLSYFRFSFSLPWPHRLPQSNRPFVVGLLNGLMPCGPLQTMQLYALGTGSFITGALSMLAFSLGTMPLMLFFGLFTGFISKSYTTKILKFSGMLVIVLGLVMVNRGLSLAGVNLLVADTQPQTQSSSPSAANSKADLQEGVQILRMSATRAGYIPNVLYVQKGVPVKWIITGEQVTSCNNEIIVPSMKMQQKLKRGETTIDFTPGDKDINFSCWMGMLRGVIKVVDNLQTVEAKAVNQAASTSIYGDDWRKVPTNRLIKKAQITGSSQTALFKGLGYEFEPLVIVVKQNTATKLTFDMTKLDNPEGNYVIVGDHSSAVISRFEARPGVIEVNFKEAAGVYDILRNNKLQAVILSVDDMETVDLEQVRKRFFRQ